MILIASDHGGFRLKEEITDLFKEMSLEYEDLGTFTEESVDYPDFAEKVASKVSEGSAEKGVLLCGTGIGISITANKFPNVRAALVYDEYSAKMSKSHNNANILVLGGRTIEPESAKEMVKIWLDTPFEGGRHQGRLDKIKEIEKRLKSKK